MINDELLHKWINNELSPEELYIFQQRPEYQSLVNLIQKTDEMGFESFDAESMLTRILSTSKSIPLEQVSESILSDHPTTLSRPKTSETIATIVPMWIKVGIAASFLLVTSLIFWPKDPGVHYLTSKNDHLTAYLPDKSEVILNVQSTLQYKEEMWDKNRELDLTGEAFFKVTNGSTFTVHTLSGSIEVLGTQFNVKSRKDILEVFCAEGKVLVKTKDEQVNERLLATETIRINSLGKIERWEDELSSGNSWISGITKLRDVSLNEVLSELERQFNIDIDRNGLNETERMSCNFQHDNLELALQTTIGTLNIKYEIVNTQKVKLFK